MTIKEVTLLSKEEYEKHESVIPKINCRWWLRSPGKYQSLAAGIHYDGDVSEIGFRVNDGNFAVRPALLINLEMTDNRFWYKPEKLIGTKIKYGNCQWTILDAKFGELYALCDNIIDYKSFDSESNNWDKSELKQWLETEGLKLITK